MSSSNLVAVRFIKETTYGVTPATGSFSTARFISEALSGTADTVESKQIRTDHLSSGQIVTGVQVGGQMGFELAKESALDEFLASAMFSTWTTATIVTTPLTVDGDDLTLTRTTGSFITDGVVAGDILTLSGFTAAANNVQVQVGAVTSATVLAIVGPRGLIDGTGATTAYKRADKISIGTNKYSFSLQKSFLDLTTKAIIYRGVIVSQMELNIAFGDLVGGSFTLSANDYQTVSTAAGMITDGRTILPAATTPTFNGSIDMAFLASAATGILASGDLSLQSVNLTLNNNTNPQNVIGYIAPRDYSAGTASVEVKFNAYLTDSAWSLLGNKLNQIPFALGFLVRNSGGFYGFYMPAVQVSFPDPSSGGQNQDVTLEMEGRAKVGANGESSLTIYKS